MTKYYLSSEIIEEIDKSPVQDYTIAKTVGLSASHFSKFKRHALAVIPGDERIEALAKLFGIPKERAIEPEPGQ